MKIDTKQLSQSLFESVQGKNKEQAKQLIKNFASIIIEHNELSQVKKVISYFNDYWDKEHKILQVEVVSAYKITREVLASIEEYVVGDNDYVVEFDNKIDNKIKGGVIIRFNNKILDGSLKTRIQELKNELIK